MNIVDKVGIAQADVTGFLPVLYRLSNDSDRQSLAELLSIRPGIIVIDDIQSQLKELIKSLFPAKKIKADEYSLLIEQHLKGTPLDEYGIWVYYPWSNKLIHLLDEEEFVEVRTNRNRYKITREEQAILRKKKVGIIGLSVGQSIALTLAMERTCGELRLADFDTAELSNLNRIRTGVQNLGLKKTIIAAREIAEIDPFIKVKLFSDGITAENIDQFFTEDGKIDLLVEVCDALDIKIISRFKARELKVPVVMDTNDRGMLDIERFDLEADRPVLHGLIGDVDTKKLGNLSGEEKIALVLNIAGHDSISVRGRASMVEVEQSINTWPQLASSVVLGGAVTTDVCRRIFLNRLTVSGRYYIDLDDIISQEDEKNDVEDTYKNPHVPLDKKTIENVIAKMPETVAPLLTDEQLETILKAAIAAPSTGNDQPWKWYYDDGTLYLLHDEYRSFSFGDFNKIASYLTFGAVVENVILAANAISLHTSYDLFPLGESSPLITRFTFSPQKEDEDPHRLVNYIFKRHTNRNNVAQQTPIPQNVLDELTAITKTVEGADLKWLLQKEDIHAIGKIIGACDRIRLLNTKGHEDFVKREMRWTPADAERTLDGIDVLTLGLSKPQVSALEVIKDPQVIRFLYDIKGGNLLSEATVRSIDNSGAIGLITLPGIGAENYIQGGRAMEKMWLAAEKHEIALHPVISPLYLFPRILQGNGEDLTLDNIAELKGLRKKFIDLFGIDESLAEVFLFKISFAPPMNKRALRLPIQKVLFRNDS